MRLLIELDKAGAEWVVVAYLSGDGNMLEVIKSGYSPHVVTGSLISGAPYEFVEKESKLVGNNTDPTTIEELRMPLQAEIQPEWFMPRIFSIRQMGKKSNHGLNYNMKYKRFALENEIMENIAKEIVEKYHRDAYPGIKIWHRTIENKLREDRSLTNCFGRKCRFMDGWGPTLFDAAFSYLPQSTVFDITRIAMDKFYYDESPLLADWELLAQVHDSLLFQYDIQDTKQTAAAVIKLAHDYMNPLCVYNSREFYIGTTMKAGTNWGNMYDCPIVEDVDLMAHNIEKMMDKINGEKAA